MEMMGNESMIWEGHPTWRAMLSFHIKWIAITLVVFGFLVLLDSIGVNLPTTLIGAVLIGGIALTILAGWVDRFFTQYTITTKRLNIRRGILSKTESSTNVDRIQNITVKQSPVDRIMKVGSIDFDTASDDASDKFSFNGVNNPQGLRERIMHAREDKKAAVAVRPAGRPGLTGRAGRSSSCSPRSVAAAVAGQPATAAAPNPRVTFIGDSIAAASQYEPDALRILTQGIDLDPQLAVCRRLGQESCPYKGTRPLTLVDLLPTVQPRARQ